MEPDDLRILVVSHCFPPAWDWGGPTRSIWNLARGLERAGARVRVVTTNADLETVLDVPARRVEEGVDIRTCPVGWLPGRGRRRFAFAPGLSAAVAEAAADADLAVVQGVWTWVTRVAPGALRRAGVPYVLCPRGTLEERSLGEKAAKKAVYWRLFERRAVLGAAALQFASAREAERSRAAVGDARAIVQPNAIELAPRVHPDRAGLAARLDLDPGLPLLGLFGRLHPRKGIPLALEAVARCRRRPALAIFGPDESGYGAFVRSEVERLGLGARVRLAGALRGEELQRAYASVAWTLVPSVAESFGNVAIESLAQGTRCLVSDEVPVGEYVAERGFGAVLPRDPDRWAEALDAALDAAPDAEPDTKDDAAAERVRADFGVEARGRAALDAYHALLDAAQVP